MMIRRKKNSFLLEWDWAYSRTYARKSNELKTQNFGVASRHYYNTRFHLSFKF